MIDTIQPSQEFYDEPIRVWPNINPLEADVARAVRPQIIIGYEPAANVLTPPKPVTIPNYETLQPIVVRHERVRLRWLKPGSVLIAGV